MKQPFAASLVACALLLAPAVVAPAAHAADRKTDQKKSETRPVANVIPVAKNLSAFFARLDAAPKVTNGEHGMQIVENPASEVIVARRNTDGTLSTACVDSEAAARRFFAAAPKVKSMPEPAQEK